VRRPRIKRTLERLDTPEGDLLLMWPSTQIDIRVRHPSDAERRLITALDGSRTLEQLRSEFGRGLVDEAIAGLDGRDVLEDAADDDLLSAEELERFDRQLRYFSDVAGGGLTPSGCQDRLRRSRFLE
jgi:hypothetical protein